MSTAPQVRKFTAQHDDDTFQFGNHQIFITTAIEATESVPLRAYSAFFGAGERADLPAPYHEIWVVLEGAITVRSPEVTLSATAGDYLHVPQHTPGEVEAITESRLVCIAVPESQDATAFDKQPR